MAYEAPVVLVASAARTTTGNTAALQAGGERSISLLLDVTAQSGTTPTLDITVEWSMDGGTTWAAAQPTTDAFTQVTTTTPKVVRIFQTKAPLYRIVWTLGGTTPSYTFSIRQWGIS